ncbi:DUF5050 domain-containing protein [Paenibacillus silviterrae]|uniref:DUF5050 domain-containing protein n=1 Tax=Paenibacillus silviterrae TaxID=3242194 RepID=UPI0025436A8B|nr:DUF5050 domain-containing protein [Paenibacillus chinjuensis]
MMRAKAIAGVLLIGVTLASTPMASVSVAASVPQQVIIPEFPVTVNGSVLDVMHSEYPLILYKDITYFPMTWNNSSALGISVAWDATQGLSLEKVNACLPLEQDLTSISNDNSHVRTAMSVPFPVKVNGTLIDNDKEEYPVLFYKDITYFPMTWRFTHNEFGWKTSWDASRGFGINSCGAGSFQQAEEGSARNVANGGQLAVKDDWIYMNPEVKYHGPSKLVKVPMSGGEEIKLSNDNAGSINIAGDFLYYTISDPANHKLHGIYKMKTDGTERTQISSSPISNIRVKDNWIYYIHQTFQPMEGVTGGGIYKSDGIHRMKLDGTGDEPLAVGDYVTQFFIDGDRIYYIVQRVSGEYHLYGMNLDGTEQTKLQEDVTKMTVIDGWIYYLQNYGKQIMKMKPDGTVVIPVYTSDHFISALNFREGWLYLVSGTFGIHGTASIERIRIDGTGRQALAGARATALYFAGDQLYFPQAWMGDNRLEHMRVN